MCFVMIFSSKGPQILYLQTHFFLFLGTQLDFISQPSLQLVTCDHVIKSHANDMWAGVMYIPSKLSQ